MFFKKKSSSYTWLAWLGCPSLVMVPPVCGFWDLFSNLTITATTVSVMKILNTGRIRKFIFWNIILKIPVLKYVKHGTGVDVKKKAYK